MRELLDIEIAEISLTAFPVIRRPMSVSRSGSLQAWQNGRGMVYRYAGAIDRLAQTATPDREVTTVVTHDDLGRRPSRRWWRRSRIRRGPASSTASKSCLSGSPIGSRCSNSKRSINARRARRGSEQSKHGGSRFRSCTPIAPPET